MLSKFLMFLQYLCDNHWDLICWMLWNNWGHNNDLYLSSILNRGFLSAFVPALTLRASPSFSVTIHSFTRLVSNRPTIVAFVLCSDMTFSKRIQKTSKWSDLTYTNKPNSSQQTLTCKTSFLLFTWNFG